METMKLFQLPGTGLPVLHCSDAKNLENRIRLQTTLKSHLHQRHHLSLKIAYAHLLYHQLLYIQFHPDKLVTIYIQSLYSCATPVVIWLLPQV